MPLPQRIATLTELGLTVHAQPAEQTEAPVATPAAAATAVDDLIEESLAEAMAELPGSEALTPEELAQLRAEIAEELAREGV